MKTTEENNILIAKFMGIKVHELDAPHILEDTKYHTSWDWLMPVVEKIESLLNNDGYHLIVCIEGTICSVKNEDGSVIVDSDSSSKLQATYQAVIQFIEWYNSQS